MEKFSKWDDTKTGINCFVSEPTPKPKSFLGKLLHFPISFFQFLGVLTMILLVCFVEFVFSHYMMGVLVLILVIYHSLAYGLSLPTEISTPSILLPILTTILLVPTLRQKLQLACQQSLIFLLQLLANSQFKWKRVTTKSKDSLGGFKKSKPIFSSHTSFVELLILHAKFAPYFAFSFEEEGKVVLCSLIRALWLSSKLHNFIPPSNTFIPLEKAIRVAEQDGRFLVVLAEEGRTNGKGILHLGCDSFHCPCLNKNTKTTTTTTTSTSSSSSKSNSNNKKEEKEEEEEEKQASLVLDTVSVVGFQYSEECPTQMEHSTLYTLWRWVAWGNTKKGASVNYLVSVATSAIRTSMAKCAHAPLVDAGRDDFYSYCAYASAIAKNDQERANEIASLREK